MHVIMKRISEDEEEVAYKFSTNIWQQKDEDYESVEVVGFCKFNKNTEQFLLDQQTTHKYFLENDSWEVMKVRVKLLECKRKTLGFPEFIEIATG